MSTKETPEPIPPPWAKADKLWRQAGRAEERQDPVAAFGYLLEAMTHVDEQDADDVFRFGTRLQNLESQLVDAAITHLSALKGKDGSRSALEKAEHLACINTIDDKLKRWLQLEVFLVDLEIPSYVERADLALKPQRREKCAEIIKELRQNLFL